MKERYEKMSLVTKTSFVFFMLNFIILGVFTAVLFFYFQDSVKTYVSNALDSTIMANTNELENLLHRVEIASYLIHENDKIYNSNDDGLSDIAKMITTFNPDARNENLLQLTKDYDNNLKLFNDYFKTCFGEEYRGYNNILFTDTSWPIHKYMPKRVSCTDGNGFSSSLKVMDKAWYKNAEKSNGECYWFVPEEDSNRLCMARNLKYKYITADGKYLEDKLGVLVVCFDISTLADRVDLKGLTQDAEILLLNREDIIVYSNQSDRVGMITPEDLKNIGFMDISEVTYEGKKCQVNQKELPLGLKILTIIPINSINQIIIQAIYIIVIMGFVMLILAFLLTILLSYTVILPIKRFAEYMKGGKWKRYEFDKSRKDELGVLYMSFYNLMEQLENTMQRELEANEEKRQAELHALQAQINPHFIYNTLNAISCLAMINQQENIAEIVDNLTKVIRYNIKNPDRLVTVAEEIYVIRQYENIQYKCHYGSVLFEYDIASEAEQFLIPKLIIQPLIENSLIHSKNYTEKMVKVRLTVQMKTDELVITVWDNGTDANLDKINKYLTGQVEHMGDSLGIRNVYDRINMVYGDLATLEYKKDYNGNTVAIIHIQHEESLK